MAPLFDACRTFYGQSPDPELAYEFLREEPAVFVALEGETAAGFTQLCPLFSSVSARRLSANDLFVSPAARERGAGTALLEEARRFAAETGAKGLVLATAVNNLPAQRLYERMGWKKDETFYHFIGGRVTHGVYLGLRC